MITRLRSATKSSDVAIFFAQMESPKAENHSSVSNCIEESVGTSENQIAQLLRLPGRSGLPVSPNATSSNLNSIEAQTLTMYSNQVGGHRVLVKPKDSSVVLKPYDEAEFNFYDQCMPVMCSCLMPFTARCYGEVDLRSPASPDHPAKGGKYVMLEDLAHGISKPCILDLKMGLKQRSIHNYSFKKLQSKAYKSISTTSHQLGFRLGGAQLYQNGQDVAFYNKYFGRLQDAEGTYTILKCLFGSVPNPNLRKNIIEIYVSKLKELRAVLRGLKGLRFWSGSLLLVFDSVGVSGSISQETVMLKMIDFANYTRLPDSIESAGDFDREYDYGIECLVKFLEGIINKETIESVLSRIEANQPPDPEVQDKELMATADA